MDSPAPKQVEPIDVTGQRRLSIIIKRPERVEYTGVAKAVSSLNMRGPFDVLPYHANFISLIRDRVIIHLEDAEPIGFKLQGGIMKVTNNTVTILIGIETGA